MLTQFSRLVIIVDNYLFIPKGAISKNEVIPIGVLYTVNTIIDIVLMSLASVSKTMI